MRNLSRGFSGNAGMTCPAGGKVLNAAQTTASTVHILKDRLMSVPHACSGVRMCSGSILVAATRAQGDHCVNPNGAAMLIPLPPLLVETYLT